MDEFINIQVIDILANDQRYSALHTLVSGAFSSIEGICQLLQAGVHVNSLSDHYVTPLHIACRNNNCSPDVVKYLLERGANVHAEDNNGKAPLHYLLECNIDSRVMDILSILADYHPVINEVDNISSSVLHYAVKGGHSKCVIEALIDLGANINQKDVFENSPLHYAVISRSWDIIELFLKRKVHLTVPNRDYMQPLHLAAQNRDPKIVKLLLSGGAWLNVVDRDNHSPLLLSACYNTPEVTKLLLDSGALLSCGESPLRKVMSTHNIYGSHVASENVRLLLKYAVLEEAVSRIDCTRRALSGLDVSVELAQYWEECQREIHTMQSVSVNPGTMLSEFIFQLRWQMKSKTGDDVKRISDQLLHHIYLNTFPLYNEIMFGIIKRKYLLVELRNRVVCAVSHQINPCSGEPKSAVLHKFVLGTLTRYLSKGQLLNLVLALYDSVVTTM